MTRVIEREVPELSKVVFRVDASVEIGTGHVARCLTLADALRQRGAACCFVCRSHPGNLIDRIQQRGYQVHVLPFDEGCGAGGDQRPAHVSWLGCDCDTDAEQTKAAIGGMEVDWLVVDHYALDVRWEERLRPFCRRVMVIDDLADRPHDCDLLLDQNLIADFARRYDDKVPVGCGLMLGPEFALLQPQYAELRSRTPPREGPVRSVLVYFGGADHDNLTGKTLTAVLALDRREVAIDVVINSKGPHAHSVRGQVGGRSNIVLHTDVPSLAPMMVRADLAIGAGGATSWERCCLGLPSLIYTLAQNQKPIAAELNRQGLIRWMGHKDEFSASDLGRALEHLFDEGVNLSWSERCRLLLDGRGVERVTAIMALNVQTPLRARRARVDDEARILRWANDFLVRRNAFNPRSIDAAVHHEWFRQRLRDLENCRFFVVETEDGLPVGQVRFERSGDEWETHYSLDAWARGRRIGKSFLRTAILALGAEAGDQAYVWGRVKKTNESSHRVFRALGFDVERSNEEEIVYRGSLSAVR